jgi:hypothetical protein
VRVRLRAQLGEQPEIGTASGIVPGGTMRLPWSLRTTRPSVNSWRGQMPGRSSSAVVARVSYACEVQDQRR